jgi:hypothetical protein
MQKVKEKPKVGPALIEFISEKLKEPTYANVREYLIDFVKWAGNNHEGNSWIKFQSLVKEKFQKGPSTNIIPLNFSNEWDEFIAQHNSAKTQKEEQLERLKIVLSYFEAQNFFRQLDRPESFYLKNVNPNIRHHKSVLLDSSKTLFEAIFKPQPLEDRPLIESARIFGTIGLTKRCRNTLRDCIFTLSITEEEKEFKKSKEHSKSLVTNEKETKEIIRSLPFHILTNPEEVGDGTEKIEKKRIISCLEKQTTFENIITAKEIRKPLKIMYDLYMKESIDFKPDVILNYANYFDDPTTPRISVFARKKFVVIDVESSYLVDDDDEPNKRIPTQVAFCSEDEKVYHYTAKLYPSEKIKNLRKYVDRIPEDPQFKYRYQIKQIIQEENKPHCPKEDTMAALKLWQSIRNHWSLENISDPYIPPQKPYIPQQKK